MTLGLPSTTDLLTPLNLANWSSEGSYESSRHLRLVEHEVIETLQQDSLWDILICQAPPRHGKTSYLSQRLPVWYHSVYPKRSTILTSYAMDLSRRSSRFVRDEVHRVAPLYWNGGLHASMRGATEWMMAEGGSCKAAGVGGGITGRGADLLLIDDFLKNAEQALSERVRNSQWEWFQTTAFTRLEPGGKLIMLACLVGDTAVSMAGGTTKPIRDVRPGDTVQTCNGALESRKVLKHACVGYDNVLKIVLESGREVRGNARHPFMALRQGKLQWIRLRNLRKNDVLITVSPTQTKARKGFGECMSECSANGMDATSLQPAEATVKTTTASSAGQRGTGLPLTIQRRIAGQGLNIGTASQSSSTKQWSRDSMEFVQAAASRQQLQTCEGTKGCDCLSTTGTTQELCEDSSSATIATLQQDMQEQPPMLIGWLSTSDFTNDKIVSIEPDGFEPVYDMQVEGTENFIANGIVSHNTRWHEDDLIGRVLKYALEDTKLRVRELRLPALAEPSDAFPDPLGRETDEPLWPERWSAQALMKIRDVLEDYWWSALYQQRLGTHGSNEWPASYFWGLLCDEDEWPATFHLAATALDPSKGKDSRRGDFSAIVFAGFGSSYIWIDADIARRPVPEMLTDLVEFNHVHRPIVTGIEANQFQELLGPQYFELAGMSGRTVEQPILMNNTVSKRVRVSRLGLWLRLHKIKIRNNAGGRLLVKQLKEFPNGDHDDGCFAAGTMVETPAGTKRIERVRAGEQVLTRFGWRKVHAAECTGERVTFEYSFADGTKMVATPDHPVYDGHSFSPIHRRCEVYKCESTLQRSQSALSTRESVSGGIQMQSSGRIGCTTRRMHPIGAVASAICTRRSGRMPMGRYHRAVTFTTKTETRSIMLSTTLSALLRTSIQRSTERKIRQETLVSSSQRKPCRQLQNGTGQQPVERGTQSMERKLASIASLLSMSATTASNHSRARALQLDSALPSAGKDSMPLSVLPVCDRRSTGVQKVYNLVVEGGEYLANGIVVHNCDAMEMALRLLLELSDELASVSESNVI